MGLLRCGSDSFGAVDGGGVETAGADAAAQDTAGAHDGVTVGPIARALAVRPHEVGHVRSLFVAALTLGSALVFFYGAANAIFLSRFEIGALGWVYVVNGLLFVFA